ncbi:hypothetical protein FB107DRAFT_193499, partial [Schizophyllum commune]
FPAPSSRHARIFKGVASDLDDFFTEYEAAIADYQVDDQSKKRHVTRFLDSERTKQFWRAVDEYADRTKTWNDYKDVIYESYPGARKGTRYSVIQLQNMSALNAQLPTKTHGDVMEWYRRFKPAATYLRAEGHISQQE